LQGEEGERGKRDLNCDMRVLVLLLPRSDCEGCETKVAVVKSRESLVSLAFVYEAFTVARLLLLRNKLNGGKKKGPFVT